MRARRHLANDKIFTVLVDCPKDQRTHCDDDYRASEQHAQDIGELIEAVKSGFGASKVYLVGTSYGTMSCSFLAKRLGAKIEGAVHTATFTDPKQGKDAHGLPMAGFDWGEARTEQFFVHHKSDPCELTRYSGLVSRKKSIPLITVLGAKGARGKPCEAYSVHGFAGRERPVMLAIADWITDRKVPETVGEDKTEN